MIEIKVHEEVKKKWMETKVGLKDEKCQNRKNIF